jgi:hypothetical protein
LLLVALALPAQTLIEHSLGTARAAGAAAGMQKVGKVAASLADKTAKTLDTAAKSTSTVITVPKSKAAPPVKLSPPPDPAAVKIGMESQEVVAKFGPPAMKLSSEEDETWFYGSGPDAVTLTLREGKVAAVSGPARAKDAKPQEVTILQ